MEYQAMEYPNSNSEGKQVQIPGRIVSLLKPVRNSPFFASQHFKWYLINVGRSDESATRSYCQILARPRMLRTVLSTFLGFRCQSNGHSFFMLTSPRQFDRWKFHYPMNPVVTEKGNKSDKKAKKLKRLKAKKKKHNRDEARQRKQKKLTKALLPQSQASIEDFGNRDKATTPLENPGTLSGGSGPLVHSMHRQDDAELTRQLARQQKRAHQHQK